MKAELEKLGLFDVTNLVIGAIIGSDIYIATQFGMKEVGPASILVWVVAGIFACITALAFAHCARVVKSGGGPYAFVKEAFGHFPGFVTGWMLWLAELSGLCVFPLAFVTYLQFFIPLDAVGKFIAVAGFLGFLLVTNYFGIKQAARINDALTIVKLFPLLLIMGLGAYLAIFKPTLVMNHFLPFAPFGFENFGSALVLIFWAYVGFEIATIPSKEIKNPHQTIPKAIVIGMGIVTIFYLLTNLALIAIGGMALSTQSAPLAFAAALVLGGLGAVLVSLGAVASVSGSDESNTIGTSRLAFMLAADGYFPKQLAKLHPKYQSPYASLIFHSLIALIITQFFSIHQLIIFSTFNFAFVYLLVTLSGFKLDNRPGHLDRVILFSSIAVCLFLIMNVRMEEMIAGLLTLAFGVIIYPFFSKQEMKDEQQFIRKEEQVIVHMVRHEEAFLANLFKHVKVHAPRLKGQQPQPTLRERYKL